MKTATDQVRVIRSFCHGVYNVITDTLCFQVVKREDGLWYWANANDHKEGGNDLYRTKKEAVAACIDYLAHRKHVPGYGFCYVP